MNSKIVQSLKRMLNRTELSSAKSETPVRHPGTRITSDNQQFFPLPEIHPPSGYAAIDDNTPSFSETARRCAMGDIKAMILLYGELKELWSKELKEFLTFHINDDNDPSYSRLHAYLQSHGEDRDSFLGANMWLVRAAVYGSEAAKNILSSAPEYNVALFPEAFQSGNGGRRVEWPGNSLRKIGLLDFAEDKVYTIEPLNSSGIYVASYYIGYDDLDETGFGMEDYYNYYFFDEFFRLLFMLRKWSPRDLDMDSNRRRISLTCKMRQKEMMQEREAYWSERGADSEIDRYHHTIAPALP